MPRDYNPREAYLKAKARRDYALQRRELREPSEPRQAPSGPTSFPIKKIDTATQRLIAEALAKRGRKP